MRPLTLVALCALATPAAAIEPQIGIALGGGAAVQDGSAPPLCCGERDEWTGLFGAVDLRGGVAFGWFAALAELGLTGVYAPETSDGSFSTGWSSARLALEARIGDDDPWRLRGALIAGWILGDEPGPELGLRLGAEGRIADHWLGGELRVLRSAVGSVAAVGLMATFWY